MSQATNGVYHDMKMTEADSMVAATSAKDGEVPTGSPAAFSITFADPMLLTRIRLVNDAGESIHTGFEPGTNDALEKTAWLPQRPPSQYELHWLADMGAADAKGVIRFTVQ